ncbi:RNA polymerase sigma factor [Pontibacillus marinus]|uniref:RNA polymerase sigma factor n=1 Tax=Pontibacillus marinus BH030004 = DSM 16465 TaxID=1385511 RepID=A0A0A5G9L9_9BACI|nr:sigma-70 family RNA polymerase sigma factor [Pontibacillus marinus]KGX87873.1 hypothetical protein N783_09290 [Pontibacillus marinus BH030004 = DSM 16465]
MEDEKSLINAYQNGNEYAADMLIHKHQTMLYRFSLRLTKSQVEADDLFQETWVRVFRSLNRYDGDRPFQTWLCTICMNLYRDEYTKKKRWLNVVKDFFSNEDKDIQLARLPSHSATPEDLTMKQESDEQLLETLNALPDKYRVPLILFYFQSFSYEEMADVLDIPVGTVRSRLSNGKKKLKETWKEVEDDDRRTV